MKQDNSQNIKSNDIAIPKQVESILGLLWVDKKWLDTQATQVSSGIDDVLKIYQTAQDAAISKLQFSNKQDVKKAMDVIALDSTAFDKLSIWFRDNLDVGKQTLKSYLEEWKSFLDVQNFIATHFSKKKQPALSQFYRDHIKLTSDVFLTSIEKQLMNLDEKTPKLYKKFSAQLLEQRSNQLVLNPTFVSRFKDTIAKNADYAWLSLEEKDSFDISIFQSYLWLKKADMTPDILMLILSLRELIHIKETQSDIDEDDESTDWDNDAQDGLSDDETQSYDSYAPLFSSDWVIDIWAGASIKLTEKEMEMNDTALENYVTAVKLCNSLWLGFVFKHKHQFLSTICGIDYLSGEWITESRLLKMLNKIWKKIGIPEKEILWNNEDGSKKIWCFKTFWEAKKQFQDIQSTGVVGWVSYDPMKSDRSVAERALIQKWFFDLKWNGFEQIEKW